MKKQQITKIGLLCIKNNKLLVVYKTKIGLWITPGGKSYPGETDIECLKREINEEINCKIKNINYFDSFRGYTEKGEPLLLKCYLGEVECNIKLNPNDTIRDYRWIRYNNYKKEKISIAPILKNQIIPKLNRGSGVVTEWFRYWSAKPGTQVRFLPAPFKIYKGE